MRNYIRTQKMNVELKADKSKVAEGVGVIWYRNNGKAKGIVSPAVSIRGKAHKVVKIEDTPDFPIVYVEEVKG